jgi:hypothetical protein
MPVPLFLSVYNFSREILCYHFNLAEIGPMVWKYILYCHMYEWLSMGIWIGFIDHFNVRLVTTLNYSVTMLISTLQITTVLSCQPAAVSTGHSLEMASKSGESSTALTKSSLHRLPYNWLPTDSVTTLTNFQTRLGYNILAQTTQKTPFTVVLQSFPWECIYLRRHYLVMVAYTCLLRICPLVADVSLFVSRSLPSNGLWQQEMCFFAIYT